MRYLHGVEKWKLGDTVKIGFLDGFRVVERIPNPDRYLPNIWKLVRNGVNYEFTPHNGLRKEL